MGAYGTGTVSTRLEQVEGAWAARLAANRGPHTLVLRAFPDVELTIPVPIVDDEVLLLRVELDERGRPLVLALRPRPCLIQDPSGLELRRVEAAQRFLAAGHPERAWEVIVRAPREADILAECLRAYLALRLGHDPGLAPLERLPEALPDRWVLAALQTGDRELAWKAALAGTPLFDLGLRALADITADRTLEQLAGQRLGGQAVTALAGNRAAATTEPVALEEAGV